jgi:hypothetical protein
MYVGDNSQECKDTILYPIERAANWYQTTVVEPTKYYPFVSTLTGTGQAVITAVELIMAALVASLDKGAALAMSGINFVARRQLFEQKKVEDYTKSSREGTHIVGVAAARIPRIAVVSIPLIGNGAVKLLDQRNLVQQNTALQDRQRQLIGVLELQKQTIQALQPSSNPATAQPLSSTAPATPPSSTAASPTAPTLELRKPEENKPATAIPQKQADADEYSSDVSTT